MKKKNKFLLPKEADFVLDWLGRLTELVFAIGYPGVVLALIIEGLGLPFPGDAAMAFYGIAAAQGSLNFWGVLGFSVLGYMIGATMAYGFSYSFGARILDRALNWPIFSQRSMRQTTRLIDRYGPLLLVPGRFLPGVRSVSSYVAGAAHMEFRSFLIYTGLGVAFWCAAWVAIGYWFGENLHPILHFATSSMAYVTGAALIAVLVIWWWRQHRVEE